MGLLKKDKIEPKPVLQNLGVPKPPTQAKKGISLISQDLKVIGDIFGSDDLTVEGIVEGKIEVKSHLFVQTGGTVKADIFAKKVTISGKVYGNIQAEDTVELQTNGFLEGNITSPKITIQEGAHFKGSVDMKSNIPPKEQKP